MTRRFPRRFPTQRPSEPCDAICTVQTVGESFTYTCDLQQAHSGSHIQYMSIGHFTWPKLKREHLT